MLPREGTLVSQRYGRMADNSAALCVSPMGASLVIALFIAMFIFATILTIAMVRRHYAQHGLLKA